MAMRCASVYRRVGTLYVHSDSKLPSGLPVPTEPFVGLPENSSPEEIGRAVSDALAASTTIEMPPDGRLSLVPEQLFALAGVRSWYEFMKRADFCFIEEFDGQLWCYPHKRRPMPYDPQYEPIGDDVPLSLESTALEIGRAVQAALDRCES